MAVRDHSGLAIDKFNGLWSRGDLDNTPRDHFSDCGNVAFIGDSSFRTRPGVGISQGVLVPLSNVKRVYNYATQDANTLLVLTYDGTNGSIYHIVGQTVLGPIITIAGMIDFAFVPYAGRAYISPFSSQQLFVSSPSAALIPALVSGAGVEAGVHGYAIVFVTATGKTTPSPIVNITTIAQLANPTVVPVLADLGAGGSNSSSLVPGATYKWLFTYMIDGLETNIGGSTTFVAPANNHYIGFGVSSAWPSQSMIVNVYRTLANGSVFYREYQNNISSTISVGASGGSTVGTIDDTTLATRPVAPSVNSTQRQRVNLSPLPISSSAGVTSRELYRTIAGGAQLKLLTVVTDNVTTLYTDSAADGTLGALAPKVNTAIIVGSSFMDKGLSGEFVYVYAGDGTPARKAAGSGIIGTMTIANGASGHTDPGMHIFGFVSQTISGYNTPPTILTQFTTSATSSVSFGSITTDGNPNVVKRLLVATKVIKTFNGNLAGYQFFFVPNAVLNDNSSTALNNISFFDADLLADASQLIDNYTEIPAGAVLTVYHNRLCVGATFNNISIFLVSQPGEPEAISQISGLIIVPPDGNAITNGQELRDVFYVFKRSRTVAYVDNGGDPSSWGEIVIDNALGTSVHGIATVLDSGSSSIDFLIVATYQGITQFNGRYVTPELSWKISKYWSNLDRTTFNRIQIVNAPIQKELYCILPSRRLMVGNYANGLDWKSVRWSPWYFLMGVNTIAIQNINDILLGADYG